MAGCGGDSSDEQKPKPKPKPKPAASPQQFIDRFEPISGVRLEPADDSFGTRLEAPEEPDRFVRYGTYSLTWTKDDRIRDIVLGRGVKPDADGIYWSKVSDSWSAAKPYGPRLVMEWVGERTKTTDPAWDRIERAVRAAYLGRPEILPKAEQPCSVLRLNPLRGPAGECSVAGIPVTYDDAAGPLTTDAVEARVLGVEATEEVGEGTVLPQHAKGRYVVVAYKVRNTGDQPLRFYNASLRLGGETLKRDAGAEVSMPRSRDFPLPPGEDVETSAVFDVDPDLADTARAKGALVLPAATDENGNPEVDLAQGWIRLARAPAKLPKPPEREREPGEPPPPPEPKGPPDIKVDVGSGPPIGGTARRLYMANTYFPLPKDFVAGGVRVGSKAGGCEVPRPTAADRSGLRRAARKESPEGRVPAPKPREILLADCGSDGRRAIMFWRVLRPGKPLKLAGDEFRRRGSRWVGTSSKQTPGCGLPEAAAAVWQIDISVCDQPPGP